MGDGSAGGRGQEPTRVVLVFARKYAAKILRDILSPSGWLSLVLEF